MVIFIIANKYLWLKMNKSLLKILDFIKEVDQLKNIFRRSYIKDGSRRENDAEHSWHICLMAVLLAETANQKVDVLKVLKMLLIHDLVEIETGDTFLYDKNRKNVFITEKAAAKKMFALLPSPFNKEMYDLWIEFEQRETAEAKFARALDRLQPIMLNYLSYGKTWLEANIKKDDVLKVNEIIADGSVELWKYAKDVIAESKEKGYLK